MVKSTICLDIVSFTCYKSNIPAISLYNNLGFSITELENEDLLFKCIKKFEFFSDKMQRFKKRI